MTSRYVIMERATSTGNSVMPFTSWSRQLPFAVCKQQFRHHTQLTMSRCSVTKTDSLSNTLHYYSPQAYDFVCQVFLLPHPTHIRSWAASVDCEPGFLKHIYIFRTFSLYCQISSKYNILLKNDQNVTQNPTEDKKNSSTQYFSSKLR